MKRSLNSFSKTSRLSKAFLPLTIATVVLPVGALLSLGIYALIDYDYWLYFLISWGGFALITSIPLLFVRRKKSAEIVIEGDSLVEPSVSWSEYDLEIWEKLRVSIAGMLEKDSRWEILKDHSLELIHDTAGYYHGEGKSRELAFSIPELLLMIEELSRRYRSFLLTHVPLIENVNLSQIKMGYDNKKKVQNTLKSLTWLHNIYRVVRLTNVPVAFLSELRSKLLGAIYDHVSKEVQLKLKKALLLEVSYVAIDLYNGRYKVSDEELPSSQIEKQDFSKIAAPLDPLRIALVGQVSSGKSSIVNALMGSIVAEINMLPSTDKATVYECNLDGMEALKIVDLPGIDGNKKTRTSLLKEVSCSDLVIWVLKANQPAKTLDLQFLAQLEAFYCMEENKKKRRPVFIGVLTQVDRLKPSSEWSPPYDYVNPKSNKAQTIKDALVYNQNLLNLTTLIPVSVCADKEHFNLSELKDLIDKYFSNAIQTQINRRRHEVAKGIDIPAQFTRIFHTGKSLFRP